MLEFAADLAVGVRTMKMPVARVLVTLAVCGLLYAHDRSPPTVYSPPLGCKPAAPVHIDEVHTSVSRDGTGSVGQKLHALVDSDRNLSVPK